MEKTVVEIDLAGYSTIANALQDALGVETSRRLNQQIQDLVDRGLANVGASRAQTVAQTTGDGAILIFDDPRPAHDFAAALHAAARAHRQGKTDPLGLRVFRAGMATGELLMEARPAGGFEFGGMAITRAVRLEAKARPGGMLIDAASFSGLDGARQRLYDAPETVAGKRDEQFPAHRIQFDPDGPANAAKLDRTIGPAQPAPSAGDARAFRRAILAAFAQLKDFQYDALVFRLDVPFGQRPPALANLEQRKAAILHWAEQEAGGLELVWEELQALGSGDAKP